MCQPRSVNGRSLVSRALPGLRPVVEAHEQATPGVPPPADPAERRAEANAHVEATLGWLIGRVAPLACETDHRVPVDGGEITVRTYSPGGDGLRPGHVSLHGGGWWMGTLEQWDPACRSLARDVGCVVASVGYRLAPEHRFPVAVEDSYRALCWVVDHAAELRIDPGRLSIGGGSAGGNLAAAVALVARDRHGPDLLAQVLEVPATDLTMSQSSVEENGSMPVFGKADYAACVADYLADPEHAWDPYASPLLATDLSGLPPALVMTAELDVLRDEGEAYARRLGAAGVDVELVRWPGQFHGTQTLDALIPDEAAAYRAVIVEWLRRAHHC